MTGRIQLKRLPDSAVDAAENEGMPVPDPANRPEQGPGHGRLNGTLRLRHAKSHTGSMPPMVDPVNAFASRIRPKPRPRSKLIAKVIILAGAIASLVFPALA